jgi:amidase
MRTFKILSLLALSALLAAACAQPATTSGTPEAQAFVLEEATIAELQARMESGEMTSKQIVEAYIARIEEIDRSGPTLRSVLEVNPDALKIAEELDRERAEKGPRGPLHGIPVLLKDNIDTADSMETTAGSLALAGSKPQRDAFIVRQLRAAGAVILGKTNLSEWANFRSTKSSSGWSARGGQTRNPFATSRNPSGSSSGSAVAVSANLTAVAIGTETDGSIVSPSSVCGIVGIKPTVGLVSRSGIIPIAHSQDTAGPMARTVTDAAALLAAMSGVDPDDSATAEGAGHMSTDYSEHLDADALKGARIGIVRSDAFHLPTKGRARFRVGHRGAENRRSRGPRSRAA